jgi:ubiquinone/menaquinone biosynthesis C-methylase UbiE
METREQWKELELSTAQAYEHYLVPLLFAPGAEYLTQLAAPAPGERVLDVACGTGSVARRAIREVGSEGTVVGLDLSKAMLQVARQVSSEIEPAIQWHEGEANDLPFPDASFEVVFCQQGLQFFRDPSAALREMHRVLAPSGRLALAVLRSIGDNPGWALLADALERHVGPEAGATMRSPFPSFSTESLRELILSAGFREVRVMLGIGPVRYPSAEELLRTEATSWLLARPLRSLDDGVRETLVRDLQESLSRYADDEGIVFPAETYLALARH